MLWWKELSLIRREPISAWTQDPRGDCAVVLTGGAGRVREGFGLLSRRAVRKLIVSGVHPDAELLELMPYWSVLGDLSEHDVVLERNSMTTFGNAQQARVLVEALGCTSVVLVTSASHMRRAGLTFRAALGDGFSISQHAIFNSASESDLLELGWEAFKSLFYSFWAYP